MEKNLHRIFHEWFTICRWRINLSLRRLQDAVTSLRVILLRSHVGASGIADENLKNFFTRRQRMSDESDGRWQMYEEVYLYFCFSHRWDMMKIKRPQDEARVENIFEIYCSVKFHQTAINQKLNLSDDAIFILSAAHSIAKGE